MGVVVLNDTLVSENITLTPNAYRRKHVTNRLCHAIIRESV